MNVYCDKNGKRHANDTELTDVKFELVNNTYIRCGYHYYTDMNIDSDSLKYLETILNTFKDPNEGWVKVRINP